MKNNNVRILRVEIEAEFNNIRAIVKESEDFLNQLEGEPTIFELRAIGSIVHDFYSGIEKIFRKIAIEIDGSIPSGSNWHIDLLNRMSLEIPNIRPIVISSELKGELREYLQFRHVFRNVYGFELKWINLLELVRKLKVILEKILKEIDKFILFLDEIEKLNTHP